MFVNYVLQHQKNNTHPKIFENVTYRMHESFSFVWNELSRAILTLWEVLCEQDWSCESVSLALLNKTSSGEIISSSASIPDEPLIVSAAASIPNQRRRNLQLLLQEVDLKLRWMNTSAFSTSSSDVSPPGELREPLERRQSEDVLSWCRLWSPPRHGGELRSMILVLSWASEQNYLLEQVYGSRADTDHTGP